MIQFAASVSFMIPLLRIVIGVQKTFSKATVNFILGFLEPEESLETGLLAHLSLSSTVWDASRTSQLSLVWAESDTRLQAAAQPCPVLSLLPWPTRLPRMALPHYRPGRDAQSPPLTNAIGNVTCEDKDASEVCLWIKHTKLPGQHLPKLIMLQRMTISQIKRSVGNYKETWHKAGVRLEKKHKRSTKTPNRRERPGRGNSFLKGVWFSQRLVGSCRGLHKGGGPASPAGGTCKQGDLQSLGRGGVFVTHTAHEGGGAYNSVHVCVHELLHVCMRTLRRLWD